MTPSAIEDQAQIWRPHLQIHQALEPLSDRNSHHCP
ncbi:hypothetical protein BVRB_8g186800 [Beta vulgaris subsp. vulgaris]|nr:hypothetical protein BVRB_8g186800 [Beta vulgaris subsp. vulgaris]